MTAPTAASLFRAAVKPDTFLDHYLNYLAPLETPVDYDFWCGLFLLSCAVGRDCYVARPKAPVRLNLYAVLCADAGTTRKSTAVSIAESIFNAAGLAEHYTVFSSSASPESFMQRLAEKETASATIMVSELVTFLGRETYSMGMPGVLTDLYDCPAERVISRTTGTHTLRNVFVSFLSASTPSWLVKAINPDVIEGGFTSRCIFIVANEPKHRVAWPNEDADSGAITTLATSLAAVRQRSLLVRDRTGGAVDISDSAKTAFVDWYNTRKLSDEHDPFLSSFEAREDHHVLRLAALLSVNDMKFVIDAHHMKHAIRIIKHHKGQAARLFGGGKMHHKLVLGIDKLRDKLFQAGMYTTSKTELLYATRHFIRKAELDFALTIMHELDMVQVFEKASGGMTRTEYRGTQRLMARDLRNLIHERMFGE